MLRHFKPNWDEIWQECSLSEYTSSDGVTFRISHHKFNMAAVKLKPAAHRANYCHHTM